MDKPELTMEDLVTLVDAMEHEFIIHVEIGKGDDKDAGE